MSTKILQVGLKHSETITIPAGLTVPEMADRSLIDETTFLKKLAEKQAAIG